MQCVYTVESSGHDVSVSVTDSLATVSSVSVTDSLATVSSVSVTDSLATWYL